MLISFYVLNIVRDCLMLLLDVFMVVEVEVLVNKIEGVVGVYKIGMEL